MNKDKVIFRVTEVGPADNGCGETQIKMVGTNGTRLRFYPDPDGSWNVVVFIAGKISAKNLKYIVDDWYFGDKKLHPAVGDTATVMEKPNINGFKK